MIFLSISPSEYNGFFLRLQQQRSRIKREFSKVNLSSFGHLGSSSANNVPKPHITSSPYPEPPTSQPTEQVGTKTISTEGAGEGPGWRELPCICPYVCLPPGTSEHSSTVFPNPCGTRHSRHFQIIAHQLPRKTKRK